MSKKNKIRRLSDVIVDIRKEINNNESQENKDAVRVLLDEANQIIDKNKKADKGIGYAMSTRSPPPTVCSTSPR